MGHYNVYNGTASDPTVAIAVMQKPLEWNAVQSSQLRMNYHLSSPRSRNDVITVDKTCR